MEKKREEDDKCKRRHKKRESNSEYDTSSEDAEDERRRRKAKKKHKEEKRQKRKELKKRQKDLESDDESSEGARKKRLLKEESKKQSWSEDGRLRAYVEALCDENVQNQFKAVAANTVLTLPSDVLWLGNTHFGHQLLVRSCFLDILEAREGYISAGRQVHVTVLSGTPGVGKSAFGAFYCSKLLVEGTTVVLQLHPPEVGAQPRFYKLSIRQGHGALVMQTTHQEVAEQWLGEDAENVYIVDGGLPCMEGAQWIISSPNRDLARLSTKSAGLALDLYMPLWTLKELKTARELLEFFNKKLTSEDVEAAFAEVGGSARECLEAPARRGLNPAMEVFRTNVRAFFGQAATCDLLAIATTLNAPGGAYKAGSDRVFHMDVPEGSVLPKAAKYSPSKDSLRRYTRRYLKFASGTVAILAAQAQDAAQAAQVAAFCIGLGQDYRLSALRGYDVEELCDMLLQSSRKLRIRFLDTQQEHSLKIPRTKEYSRFGSNTEVVERAAADMSVYLKPTSKTQVAIDALRSPCFLIQCASGPSHSIKRKGLSALLTDLKTSPNYRAAMDQLEAAIKPRLDLDLPVLFFATTPNQFHNSYQQNQLYAKGQRTSGVSQRPLVHQAVIRLPLDELGINQSPSRLRELEQALERLAVEQAE